jgi:hypothetical protein
MFTHKGDQLHQSNKTVANERRTTEELESGRRELRRKFMDGSCRTTVK